MTQPFGHPRDEDAGRKSGGGGRESPAAGGKSEGEKSKGKQE